jgi:hypothetical protein
MLIFFSSDEPGDRRRARRGPHPGVSSQFLTFPHVETGHQEAKQRGERPVKFYGVVVGEA